MKDVRQKVMGEEVRRQIDAEVRFLEDQVKSKQQAGYSACLAYSLTLKIEVVHSSEISVNFCRATRRHIPEDNQSHCHNFHADCIVLNVWKTVNNDLESMWMKVVLG
jgi:hypothetical protein